MAEKYENKFVELYKEGKKLGRELGSLKAERLSEEEWNKKCDKLAEAFKKIPKDIDEDIEKLTKTKRLFTRREDTRCDMVTYYIEEDCERKPSECPAEIKKIMIEDLKENISDAKQMLGWGPSEESGVTKEKYSQHYNEEIKKIEEQIERLK